MNPPQLIKVSDSLIFNSAYLALSQWEGAALVLHFITTEPGGASAPAKQSIRILEGEDAKRCWAMLAGVCAVETVLSPVPQKGE
jgi:hypothetical protein